jgi:hypothetical protein
VQHVKADEICILEGTDPLLIIQEDKSHLDPFYNVFVCLIAAAVASFSADASYREQYDILARRNDIIYGIIMNGSWPTFYKIPGLRTLTTYIEEGIIGFGISTIQCLPTQCPPTFAEGKGRDEAVG